MESFLTTLKEQVKCSLCNEMLNEPKLLPCFHVFCTSCIKGHLQLDEEENNTFHCPQCDSESLLQDPNDVQDLQISPVHSRILKVLEFIESQKVCSVSSSHPVALWHCLDCDRLLCEECLLNHSEFIKNHHVVSLSELKEEDVEVMLKKERPCKVHDGHIVESYCKNCDMLICAFCMKSHCHKHDVTPLEASIAIEKDSLSKILEDIQEINEDEEEKKQQEEIALKIKNEGEKAKKEIKELTEKLIKTLKSNEQRLLDKIHKSITKADRNLRVIRHTTQAQEYIKYFMENGTASEMIITRQGESSDNFTYDPLDHSVPGVKFKANEVLCEQVECGLGKVRTYLKKADPQMSSVRVEPSEIEALRKAQLIINLKTSKREDTDEALKNVKITFTPHNSVKEGELQMADDSEITMDFTPLVCGPLTANIALHDDEVFNSPLVMLVKPQLLEKQTGYCRLKNALNTGSKDFTGIAVNTTNSKIAVADCKLHCIGVYNMEGDLLLTYGSKGSGQRGLHNPQGLAFLNETDLVVVDSLNYRICIVDSNAGKLVRFFGSKGGGSGQFINPLGVHVDKESQHIIVCDCSNSDRVQVFTRDGDFLYQLKTPRPHSVVKHNGQFYTSCDLPGFLMSGVIYVNERKDDGTVTTVGMVAGGKNYSDGKRCSPRGLVIDNDSNLLVCCDAYYHPSVHKFTLDGQYVGQSGQLGHELCYITGQLGHKPRYITVLPTGQIICTTNKGVIFLK